MATSRKLASPSVPGIFTPFSLSLGPCQAKANTSVSAVHAPHSAPHAVELLLSFGQLKWQHTLLLHTPFFCEFPEASLTTCCAISAPFCHGASLAWIIGHFVKPRNLLGFLRSLLPFLRARCAPQSTLLSSGLQPQPSRPCWARPAFISPRACGWHQCSPPRLHSKPAQLPDCGWQIHAVRCACTRPCTRHKCQLFVIVLCTSNKNSGNDPLQCHTTGSLHHLGPFAPPPIHRQRTHRLSLSRIHRQQVCL